MKQHSPSAAQQFTAREPIRVVPLHQPKPVVAIDDLARRRGGEAGAAPGRERRAASPSAQLTYRDGPLLQQVQVFSIFWGTQWGAASSATDLMKRLNQFFADILVSPLIDQLAEYNVAGQTIGHGAFLGTKTITANAPVDSVTDSAIQAQLQQWIAAQLVPSPTANTVYFIYLDPGVASVMGGSRSCQSYCGYHNNVGNVYYAVMPYPGCDGCLGGMDVLNALTGTSSHELCEAITDPVPGTGWYDDTNGEIGDRCAWSFKTVAGYTVQLEWSNQQGKCV